MAKQVGQNYRTLVPWCPHVTVDDVHVSSISWWRWPRVSTSLSSLILPLLKSLLSNQWYDFHLLHGLWVQTGGLPIVISSFLSMWIVCLLTVLCPIDAPSWSPLLQMCFLSHPHTRLGSLHIVLSIHFQCVLDWSFILGVNVHPPRHLGANQRSSENTFSEMWN